LFWQSGFMATLLTPQSPHGDKWQGKGLQNSQLGFTPAGHCAIPSSPQSKRRASARLFCFGNLVSWRLYSPRKVRAGINGKADDKLQDLPEGFS
jgi:hypothetical protein